jgi:hypothetical protein
MRRCFSRRAPQIESFFESRESANHWGFKPLKSYGDVQLDIEDFNGGWGWPEYDDLGKKNLA